MQEWFEKLLHLSDPQFSCGMYVYKNHNVSEQFLTFKTKKNSVKTVMSRAGYCCKKDDTNDNADFLK